MAEIKNFKDLIGSMTWHLLSLSDFHFNDWGSRISAAFQDGDNAAVTIHLYITSLQLDLVME